MITSSPHLGQALEVYRGAVRSLGLSDYGIQGWGRGYKVPQMVDQDGWLGPWMLKTDELAVLLLGRRIWPFAYVSDPNACEGVSPKLVDECDSEVKKQTYLRYPILQGQERRMQWPLAAKIAQFAVSDSLDRLEESREVNMRPLTGFYAIAAPLEPGEILPFPAEEQITAFRLQGALREYGALLTPAMRQGPEPTRQD